MSYAALCNEHGTAQSINVESNRSSLLEMKVEHVSMLFVYKTRCEASFSNCDECKGTQSVRHDSVDREMLNWHSMTFHAFETGLSSFL